MGDAAPILAAQWRRSAERLRARLAGLTDAEYFWEPVPGCWTVKPDEKHPGRWTYDYEWPAPVPPPVTTIGWRLVHIAADNWIYWEFAFGPGRRTFPDLDVPAGADQAIRNWEHSRGAVSEWLDTATDADLAELRPSHLGAPKSAGEVVGILIDEQVHHGAEIALLRDLYRWQNQPASTT
jgi:DinB superfamily